MRINMDNIKGLYRKFVPISVRRFVREVINIRTTLFALYSFHSFDSVVSGPFAGMKFERRCGDASKLYGTYEMELHEVFRQVEKMEFSTFIDIGAAEGFYAVGISLLKPNCSVIAYEANPELHKKIDYLSKINDVTGKIDVRGFCNIEELIALENALKEAFLIVDIEGYEKELLRPKAVPLLRTCTMLVETHDHEVPGCYESVYKNFNQSHDIIEYKSRPRDISDYPVKFIGSENLFKNVIVNGVSDGRVVYNSWLFLTPKK